MIQLYFSQGPNPVKVALMLEEIGTPYEVVRLDLYKGEQHSPEFRRLNPNGKLPVIVDMDDASSAQKVVFDSQAILLYLAEKTGMLLGQPKERGQVLSWLMFVGTGLGPFCGQVAHFRFYASEPVPYALNRYQFEMERHLDVLEKQLEECRYIAGNDYTIADVAAFGWAEKFSAILPEDRDPFTCRPNLRRWFESVNQRPAMERVRQLMEGSEAKFTIDDEARRALYAFQFTQQRS
jgi:GSH-dependent disulfide-bond oxidoreductase